MDSPDHPVLERKPHLLRFDWLALSKLNIKQNMCTLKFSFFCRKQIKNAFMIDNFYGIKSNSNLSISRNAMPDLSRDFCKFHFEVVKENSFESNNN